MRWPSVAWTSTPLVPTASTPVRTTPLTVPHEGCRVSVTGGATPLVRSTATLWQVWPVRLTVTVYRPGSRPASVNEPMDPVVSDVPVASLGPPVAVTVAIPSPAPEGDSTRP